MTHFRTLYIDMNSFFACVEQQVHPSLSGKPVAITAVDAESGAVVAASYEAKAKGVGVGTRIYEARQLCPGIVFLPSRHRLYVRANQKIAEVVDRVAELERIRSIDEFQVVLGGSTATLEGALALGKEIKRAICSEVGSELRCSIGIGPNHLLAKIAGKLEKPDGLQWLAPENMPDRIAHLKLDDLPGISRGVKHKLYRSYIWDIPALYALDPRHARMIWRSVEGERFIRALQGENIPLLGTKRGGYGQSKVLGPEHRPIPKARLVGRWLVEKAAARLRRDAYCAGRFSLSAHFYDCDGWSGSKTTMHTQDTRQFLEIYDALWLRMAQRRFGPCSSVSIHLGDVLPLKERSGELFLPLEPGRQTKKERLSQTIDGLNRRYGKKVADFGTQQDHPGFFERG